MQDWANRHAAHHNRHSPDTSGDVPPSHGHRRNSPTHHARVSRGVSAPSLRPTLIPTPPLPGGDSGMCGDDGDLSPQPLGSGSGGTANSLSKSRRRLPPTPGIQGGGREGGKSYIFIGFTTLGTLGWVSNCFSHWLKCSEGVIVCIIIGGAHQVIGHCLISLEAPQRPMFLLQCLPNKTRGGRGHWTVNYTGAQSCINMLSH